MQLSRLNLALSLALGAGTGLIAGVDSALAAGFSIPETSVTGLATSNALVANPDEVGAIAYNPAAMAFHEHSSVSTGLMIFSSNLETTTASGGQKSEGDDPILIPNLQGSLKINEQWALGLGVNAPFGLESVWPVGTFPTLSAPIPVAPGVSLPAGLFHPAQSKLELVSVVPTVAFKVNENLSLAAGLDYYDARKLAFNTHLVTIRGDGRAWGWNLAAMYKSGPLSLGASYHSATTIDLDGSFTVLGSSSIDANADLDLPSRLQLGVRYAFNDKLAAEFDWSRTGWNSFKTIEVRAEANGDLLTSSENNWDNSNAYRVGVTYDLTDATQLRFGYTYDETGQSKEHYSARIPDANRHLFSLGAGHDIGGGWQIEGAYMYVKFDDNDYRSDTPFNPASGDPNGTNALNGDYKAHVHIFGLGVSKTFM